MNRLVVAGALALATGGQVLAADLPPAAPPPPRAPAAYVPVAAPIYNWAGFYIGINGGGGFGTSTWSTPIGSTSFNTSGGLIGGTVGANFQASQFVFGVEGDLDWANIKGTSSGTNCGTLAFPLACTLTTKNSWLGTARGRVGVAVDRVLIFVTGGGAFGDIQMTPTLLGVAGGTDKVTKAGWTGGAGVEVAFTENLTGKVEYLYVNLGTASCTTACGGAPSGVITASSKTNLVRAGLNWKFGP